MTNDQVLQETPEPSRPGSPSEAPSETPPLTPDTDTPGSPDQAPAETPPLSPDIDQPAPGAEPNPTPISPIGAGVVPPPD
jgi:hypothetical protein